MSKSIIEQLSDNRLPEPIVMEHVSIQINPINNNEEDDIKSESKEDDSEESKEDDSEESKEDDSQMTSSDTLKQKYILMGLSPKNIVNKVMENFSNTLDDYKPLEYDRMNLENFIMNTFGEDFEIPYDPILTQRIAIYSQLYLHGGLFINPVHVRVMNKQFENMFDIPNINVFFILKNIRSKKYCKNSVNIHSIRKGVPEREVQVSSYFIYSKVKQHDIFIDILNLVNKRYIDSVPKNEYIESITKYGRDFLIGSDVINEIIFNNNRKYKDVVILKKESYLKYLQMNS